MDFVTFSLIIDDIVFPDGQTSMGILGGGGPQTAFGMKLWADKVGLVGNVGQDLPPEAKRWLIEYGIDLRGLHVSKKWPTLRAWQLFEVDGSRIQVWRVPDEAIGTQLRREQQYLPSDYQQAKGFHLGVHPENPDLEFIHLLRDQGAVVSVEPFRQSHQRLEEAELQSLLQAGQIFSPNRLEAESLVGKGEPVELVQRLAEGGAKIIALRLGAEGSLVYRADTGEMWHIPAVQTDVVDLTGSGNAYCGAFLVGWVQTGDVRLAGLYGTVAASFMIEQIGLPDPRSNLSPVAYRRLAQLQSSLKRLWV